MKDSRKLRRGFGWLVVILFIAGAVLILIWFSFGKAAEKALRDAEEIRRSIGG